jgi:hypothetical protein
MRALDRPFDAIAREKFIHDIYLEVDPLDDWIDLSGAGLIDPELLWVSAVDANVINVEWFLDGMSLGVLGEELLIDTLGLVAGEYTISARAYDSILDHAFSGDSLDWWRLSPDLLQQTVSWNITVAVPEPSALVLLAFISPLAAVRRLR